MVSVQELLSTGSTPQTGESWLGVLSLLLALVVIGAVGELGLRLRARFLWVVAVVHKFRNVGEEVNVEIVKSPGHDALVGVDQIQRVSKFVDHCTEGGRKASTVGMSGEKY